MAKIANAKIQWIRERFDTKVPHYHSNLSHPRISLVGSPCFSYTQTRRHSVRCLTEPLAANKLWMRKTKVAGHPLSRYPSSC
jgi:hypothetical protein